MAARVLHFGQEPCQALPVLRSAGYTVESCGSVLQLRVNLESGYEPDAVSMTDGIANGRHDAISLTRSRTPAPLILFRITDRDWFPDTEYDPTEPEFDLIVPRATPAPEWLGEFGVLIEESRGVRQLSQRIRRESSELRRESSKLRRESSELRRESSEARAKYAQQLRRSSWLLADCGFEIRRLQFECRRAETFRTENPASDSPVVGAFDRLIQCADCGKGFLFLAGEQMFFREKGLHDPTRCAPCRRKARASNRVVVTRAICAECGVSTMVPFKPTQGRPVFCRACFRESRK